MSEKSAADDFFGIEYMSSQSHNIEPSEEQESKKAENERSSKKRSFRVRTDVSDVLQDVSQLSGTEFLDRAFFPHLEFDTETGEQNENEAPKDFIEEHFFRRIDSSEKSTIRTSTKAQKGSSQLDNHLDPKKDDRRSLVKGSRRKLEDVAPKEVHQKKNTLAEHNEHNFDDSTSDESYESGLDKIRSAIIPVWRMTQDELLDLMTDRLLYKDDDIVAFDKPYGMAYSGASQSCPQLDRLLQKLKARVVPKCERLYLVRSLDKFHSGIVLFATNALVQSNLKENFENGLVEQVSRCIVRGQLEDSPLKITIPLIKMIKDRDMKLVPLVTNKAKGHIFYVESECRTIRGNQYVSSVEVLTRKEISHQIRAHLALAGCPLIGDAKYSNSSPRTPRLSDRVLNSLDVTDSQSRKIPMYLHLKEIHLPPISQSSAPIRISSPLPAHFKWMLKRLKLLKR